jgi:hypothetical protein
LFRTMKSIQPDRGTWKEAHVIEADGPTDQPNDETLLRSRRGQRGAETLAERATLRRAFPARRCRTLRRCAAGRRATARRGHQRSVHLARPGVVVLLGADRADRVALSVERRDQAANVSARHPSPLGRVGEPVHRAPALPPTATSSGLTSTAGSSRRRPPWGSTSSPAAPGGSATPPGRRTSRPSWATRGM